ncbi:N-glycosylase/DNA lyase OGG1 isoform X1 [Ricinus communis]|uniref:N-glycosylase/DNA lyase OGG1 isoform X1 n=1 Tax=Ricinus communis TaxID=3988 RepID=UPI0007722A7C|nr:N-glycosylase/DNA lyase OGG1 isoform X1 [Ricinus communis]|eukprot:XP_015575340.1 N-glycosylase/DNA lyase OGG1 isoform X1 [Ricinus communis]
MRRPIPQIPHSTAAAKSPTPSPTTPPQTIKITSRKHKKSLIKPITTTNWNALNLTQSELSLPLTFPTGQTFRWKQTGHHQYTGTLGPHLISLKHHHQNGNVYYHIHTTPSETAAKSALLDFLNINVSLANIWADFSASDSRFAELAMHLKGARVLRQDPLECLIQFLCSSNNNIARITKMVDYVSSLGQYLGNVEGFEFYEFPDLERLGLVTEEQLRAAGFGYRAKYITGTIDALQLKPGGGVEWLTALRKLDLQVVIDALCTLPGVGPKVAACIALFSLDQHHAIPVDTHVWQIATRHLLPELAGARLTPKLCSRVADAFVSKYGKYAGWAQTLLFIAELPPQKSLLPSSFWTVKEIKSANKKDSEADSGNLCCN